ncbi:hypothetical protein FRC01_005117 [Tulasnella sp. 417]|nr:hypothetical protein FRC01_005117 [Tulasnella sp. 417]
MSTTNNLPPTPPIGTPSTEGAKDTQNFLEGKRNDLATPEQKTPATETTQPPLSRGDSKASTVLEIPGGGNLSLDTDKAYATVTNAFNSAAQAVQTGLANLTSPAVYTSTNRPDLKASGPVGAPAHPSSATAGLGETIQGGLSSLADSARSAVSSVSPAQKPAGPEDPAHVVGLRPAPSASDSRHEGE